jgi:hypothetical protein
MKKEYSKQIGKKHLRVGLEFNGRTVRLNSIWAVDQPLVQLDRFAKDILVRVDVPGHPPFVEALDDPRQIRGAPEAAAPEGKFKVYCVKGGEYR